MTAQKYYYLFADGIGVFKTEKPDASKYRIDSRHLFVRDFNNWLQTGEKYLFGEGEYRNFMDYLFVNYTMSVYDITNNPQLISPERVKIKRGPINWKSQNEAEKTANTFYAYFVPIEDKPKEESQADLICEFISEIKEFINDKKTAKEAAKIIISKYSVTRK